MSTKKHGWAKWVAITTCLSLAVIAVLTVPKLTREINQSEKQRLPISYLQDLNLNAKEISTPELFSANEMPALSKDQVIESIKNSTTIQGTVSSIDCTSIKDGDKTWFITAIDIAADDVLTGSLNSDVAHIVSACSYSGVADSQMVPINIVPDIHEEMSAVFVLSELSNDPWKIAGKEVDPKVLGDYYIVCKLDKTEDTMTYSEQNIKINLSEIK